MLKVVVVLLLALHACAAVQVDLTVSPGAKGEDVVVSVVDRIRSNCIFSNDRLFLRRLAYVESRDGMDPKTYRQGFDGGIWQLDFQMYNATRTCPYIITEECDIIKKEFNITWGQTQWSDLRKPLYSGLAASLYMLLRLGFLGSMPGGLQAQAEFWGNYYHLGSPPTDFIQPAMEVKEDCKGQLDLAYIIDSSGSIDFVDYIRMLMFIQNVTRSLEFGPDATQFAAINFGTFSSIPFYFDDHSSQEEVVDAIAQIRKDDGGTRTYDALDLATDRVFTKAHGARDGIPRVAILLTDGGSADFNLTVKAAERAKQKGITILSVGIGLVNQLELEAVASDPNCTHLFYLSDFSEIEDLLAQLQKSSCVAPVVITKPVENNSTSNGTASSGPIITEELHVNETKTQTIMIDKEWTFSTNGGNVVRAEVTCGVLDIYTSYLTPNPGPAFFEEKYTATDGHPAIINLIKREDDRPLYITVIGTRLPETPENAAKCQNPKYNIFVTNLPDVEILCRENGELRQCTKLDYIHAELKPIICDQSILDSSNIANPCTQSILGLGKLIHPHPYSSNMFIKCDLTGRMYVTLCPEGDTFNKDTLSCGFETVSGPSGGSSLPSHIPNPCTADGIQRGEYFFEYPEDIHKFIHCDIWGAAWVQSCQTNFLWNDIAKTCVEDFFHEFDPSTPTPVTIHNPCVVGSSIMFYPHPDETKFIHCDVAGNYWVQSCQDGFRYEPAAYVCVPKPGMTGR